MNRFSKTIIKIKSFFASFIKSEQVITIYENNLESTPNNEHYHRGSLVESLKSMGIPSEDKTHEKIGQTRLIFSNRVATTENGLEAQAAKEEDALGASLRNLKYQRWQNKA